MVVLLIKDGLVEQAISVNSIADLVDYYPEHTLLEQSGEETVGWTYDGVSFTPPGG